MQGDGDSGAATPLLAEVFAESRTVGEVLRAHGLRIAVAESCTGGLLGAALTAIPGSSDYVLGGVIAYADAVKSAQLDVDPALLREHGAVSEPVARAMASGARRRLGADVGVAVTGVAGPGGESAAKPAGLIWLAVAGPGAAGRTLRLDGDRGREGNRAAAVRAALELVVAAVEAPPP
jgi:PncC family amidohydrolase